MKLKLLPRKEIDALKAKERQTEIQEGAKLAKRVAGLRALQVEEEAHLNKWRTETLSAIQLEIASKEKEREIVDRQLIEKKKELENALIPLEIKEMHLKKEQEKLDVSLIEVEVQKAELDEVINENNVLKVLNEKELSLRALERQENERMFAEATRILREADDTFTKADINARNLRINAKEIDAQARKRLQQVVEQETELAIKTNLLAEKEKELEQRELDVIVKELQFNSPIKYGKYNQSNVS